MARLMVELGSVGQDVKPCPFCGGGVTRAVLVGSEEDSRTCLFCDECYCRGPKERDLGDAIKCWNVRKGAN